MTASLHFPQYPWVKLTLIVHHNKCFYNFNGFCLPSKSVRSNPSSSRREEEEQRGIFSSRRHRKLQRAAAAFTALPTEDIRSPRLHPRASSTKQLLLQHAPAAAAAAAAAAASATASALAMLRRKRWVAVLLLLGSLLLFLLLLWHFTSSSRTQQEQQQLLLQEQQDAHPRGTFTSPWQRDSDEGAAAAADSEASSAVPPGTLAGAAAAVTKRPKRPQGTFFVQHLPGYTAAAAVPSASASAAAEAAAGAASHGGNYEYLFAAPLSASSAALIGKPAAAAAAVKQQSQPLKDVALPVPFAAPPSQQQQQQEQSMLLSLGSRAEKSPTFTVVAGSALVTPEQQEQRQLLLSQLADEGWRGELGALADYNNDMHVDLIFLGSSAHLSACKNSNVNRSSSSSTSSSTSSSSSSTSSSTRPPTRAASATDNQTQRLSTVSPAPRSTGGGSGNAAASSSICGTTISVYTWSPELSRFAHHVSVHLKETVDSIVAVDWTQDGRVDILAITLPTPRAAGVERASVAAAYGLVAFIQRPSGALDRVWDSQQFVMQLLHHRRASRQQQQQQQQQQVGALQENVSVSTATPTAAETLDSEGTQPTQDADALDVEEAAADSLGVAAFASGRGRLNARMDAAAAARDAAAAVSTAQVGGLGGVVEEDPAVSAAASQAPLAAAVASAAEALAGDMTDEELLACGLSGVHPLVGDLTFDHFPDLLVQTPLARNTDGSKRSGNKQLSGRDEPKVFRFFWVNLASEGKEGFAPRKWSAASDLFETGGQPEATQQRMQQEEAQITNPHSSAVADIDGDCRADLLLMVRLPGSSSISVEIWLSRFDGKKAKWKRHVESLALPQGAGQFVLADFDANGTIDLLVPTCERNEEGVCVKGDSLVLLPNAQPPLCGSFWWTHRTAEKCRRPFELCEPNEDFAVAHEGSKEATVSPLDPDPTIHFFGDSAKPPTLAVGDVDGDGFADVALVAVKEGGVRAARIYRNVAIDVKASVQNPARRRFQLAAEFVATAEGETLLCNRGALDLVCQGQPKMASVSPDPFATLRAYTRPVEAAGDSRFFKATSLNGACPYSFCIRRTLLPLSDNTHNFPSDDNSVTNVSSHNAHGKQGEQQKKQSFSLQMVPDLPPPYGAAAVGATFKLTVTDLNGTKTPRIGAQMSQSAHAPLALPFELFGLGQTNNYVEEFFVGLPLAQLVAHSMWVSLIPNSQVIVMPYPLEKPKSWQLELSVHPSRSFANILITTVICLLLVALIIFILDRKEKAEDSEQQRGFRSHFIVN
ncbi:hypothetical protein Emed_004855 [Eimeria media]